MGGPAHYTEDHGGYAHMLGKHRSLAMHNSQPDAEVVEQAPVPRWGWGVAPPYRP